MKDKIVKSVIDKYKQRSEVGIKKYNKTMERDDLSLDEWLTHLQEELMDATLYKMSQNFYTLYSKRLHFTIRSTI
jgi:cyclopropane fatty-acyl-phospholipid synthase-like methyltransferase